MQVQPSSIMAYRDAVVTAIKGAIPVGVTIEKHDGYFDDETIKRLSFAAPAVYVAVMHAKPASGTGDFRTHLQTGQQHFELNTVCFVVTKHVGSMDASDIGWAIGEVIANLAVLNAFTDPVMPAEGVGIENLWSNKTDKQGLSLLSVHWTNDIVLGTDWAAASIALAGAMPGDVFSEGVEPSLTVNETIDGGPSS